MSAEIIDAKYDPGYLYVFKLDNGIIKAGRTEDRDRRLVQHEREASKRGLSIADSFVTEQLTVIRERERLLMRALRQLGIKMPGGREYFRDLPFRMAVVQAESTDQMLYPQQAEYLCPCLELVVASEPKLQPHPHILAYLAEVAFPSGETSLGRLWSTGSWTTENGPIEVAMGDRLKAYVSRKDGPHQAWNMHIRRRVVHVSGSVEAFSASPST